MAETTTVPEARRDLRVVLPGLMLAMMLAMLDNMIVATAMPRIVGELGGLSHLSWVVTAYVLGTSVSTPIWGKLGDLYGRKSIFLTSIVIFLAGSALSGAAQGMGELIGFRALQGLGAGGLIVGVMAIIGDLVPPRERGKYQGMMAGIMAVAMVAGPLAGGFITDNLSWRWAFYINLPLGAIALAVLVTTLRLPKYRSEHRIDWLGAGLLSVGITALTLITTWGGHEYAWKSWQIFGLAATAVVALAAFVVVERRAAEPILPGWVFRSRLLNSTNVAALAIGVILIGLTSYIPLYAQGVLSTSALVGGFALAALTLGWPLAASLAGRIYLRIGFRSTALIGSGVIVIGAALLALLSPASSVWQVAGTCFVLGIGMGLATSPTLISAQSAVDWERRGVVTGTNMFSRSMGSAVGIAVFGAIANATLSQRLGGHASATAAEIPVAALDPALHRVFLAAAVVAVVLTLAVLAMPRRGLPGSRNDSAAEQLAT